VALFGICSETTCRLGLADISHNVKGVQWLSSSAAQDTDTARGLCMSADTP
jgi:hypothetical protein